MAQLKVVLDTNGLLRSISRRSSFAIVLEKLYEGDYELWVSNDILYEYEEKITDIFSRETAELILGALALLPNVKKTDIHYNLFLISADDDDNKFSDCAFAGNVHYLVTNDKHFNILSTIPFPSINVITLEKFAELLLLSSSERNVPKTLAEIMSSTQHDAPAEYEGSGRQQNSSAEGEPKALANNISNKSGCFSVFIVISLLLVLITGLMVVLS